MHQFLKDLQTSPQTQARLRRDREVEEKTVKAVQNLLNDLEPIPEVGKLIFGIEVSNDELSLSVGVRRESQSSIIQQPGT